MLTLEYLNKLKNTRCSD